MPIQVNTGQQAIERRATVKDYIWDLFVILIQIGQNNKMDTINLQTFERASFSSAENRFTFL